MTTIADIRETLEKKAQLAAQRAAEAEALKNTGLHTLRAENFFTSIPTIGACWLLAILFVIPIWYYCSRRWRKGLNDCTWVRSLKHPFPAPKTPNATLFPLLAVLFCVTLSISLVAVKEGQELNYSALAGMGSLLPTVLWPVVAFQIGDASLCALCSIAGVFTSGHVAYLYSEVLYASAYLSLIPIAVHLWLLLGTVRILYEMEVKQILRQSKKNGGAGGMAVALATSLLENTPVSSKSAVGRGARGAKRFSRS